MDPKNIPKNTDNISIFGDLIITKKIEIRKNKAKEVIR
jgi:hypothetical protein